MPMFEIKKVPPRDSTDGKQQEVSIGERAERSDGEHHSALGPTHSQKVSVLPRCELSTFTQFPILAVTAPKQYAYKCKNYRKRFLRSEG